MADRYWVGGTGTWSAASTANWAASSGGAAGASAPTAADNVFFDANSNVGTGAFTVTMSTSRVCNDFTASGLDGPMTLAGAITGLTVSGSLTWPAINFTPTYGFTTTFNATTTGKTVTTNGVSFPTTVDFNGVGGGWTLGSALTISIGNLIVTNGTFDTSSSGNYAVTVTAFNSNFSNTRTINLNASTVTVTAGAAWNLTTTTGLTFNAGTSQINCSSAFPTFAGGGRTYYNVAFTSDALSTPSITGANTFNNLTITGRAFVGIGVITISANQTINGTFTVSAGTASAYRIMIASDTIGTPRTLTCAAESLTDVDFRDIVAAGAGSPFTGTRLGNCRGNSNITFGAAKTVYYALTGGDWGVSGSGSWSATSGGALDATMFPLAQDTAIFPAATYPASGSVVAINDIYNIGTIDMSLRTSNTMTLAATSSYTPVSIYGNWINGTGITLFGTATLIFAGRTTQQLTSAGIAFTQTIVINSPSGSVTLQDAFTTGTGVVTTLVQGTLALQSYTLSTGRFSSININTRTIAFGTGNITCTGTGSVWSTSTPTNLTTTGTQVVNVTNTTATSTQVNPGVMSEANAISFNFTGGTYALQFLNTAGYTARNVNFTGYAGTLAATSTAQIYGNLIISTGMTLSTSVITLFIGATGGTQDITTNGKTLDFPVTFISTSQKRLLGAFTLASTRTLTLTAGTLSLNNFTLTAGLFSSSSGGSRIIAFGTGNITLTGTGTVWNTGTIGFLSTNGTQVVNVVSVGSTAITVINGNLSEASAFSFNFTGGTYALTFFGTAGYTARNVNFTGYSGTLAATNNCIIYGDLTFSASMTLTATTNTLTFAKTDSGDQQITTNGKTIDFPLTFDGFSGTRFRLEDALTMGSARIATLTDGTLDLNGKTMTVGGAGGGYFVTGSGTKNLTFNGGTLVIATASTTAFVNINPPNFTTTAGTGVGTISMTGATAKTFAGGGSTFNCTLNQGGAGDLTITGSNTFLDITNTVQPASVLFTAGTTNTFTNFSLSGTAGNLITISSATAATHTLSDASGIISVSFCSISYSNATGGATWNASSSTDGGNNTGWSFGGVVYNVSLSETGTSTDLFFSVPFYLSSFADTATATDAITNAGSTYNAPLVDTATATDAITNAGSTYSAPIVNTATITDTVVATSTFPSSFADSATTVDVYVAGLLYTSSVVNTATVTDTSSAAAGFSSVVADTASVTDLYSSTPVYVSNVVDTATATDTVSAKAAFYSTTANTATVTDAITNAGSIYNAPVTNNATINDAIRATSTYPASVADTATATDAYSVAATFRAQFYASTYDFSESTYGLPTGTSFTGSAIWSTTALSRVQVNANGPGTGTAGFNAGGNYIAFGTGTFGSTRLQTKTFNLVDATQLTLNYINGTGSNGGIVPSLVIQIGAYDGLVLTNILGSVPISGQSTFGDISFAIPLSSRVFNGSLRFITIVQAGGAAFGLRNITITYASGLTVTDNFSTAQFFNTQIADAATATDNFLVAPSTFNAPFVDTATITDAITNAGSIYNAPVTNTATATDVYIGNFLWNVIDDGQNVTWTLVNDSSGQTLPNIRDWVASATNGETTLVIGAPTSGVYYVARKYKQNAWVFSALPFVFGSYNIANVRWLEDRFYLVGSKTGGAFIATSTDGLTWTEITAPTGSGRVLDIARNGNTLVVAAIVRVYYSANSGTSWTSTTRTLSSARPSILWVEELNKFFVVGFNAYSSPDGATWTLATGGGQGTAGFTGIAWSGSALVIAISNSTGSSSTVRSSLDGVTWTTLGAGGANRSVAKVMWDGTQFVYYGDGNAFNYYTFTYNQATDRMVENPNNISGYRLVEDSISYNMVIVDGLYVIPGRQNDASKNYFYTSTDLVTFSIPEYSGPWYVLGTAGGATWQTVSNAQSVVWAVVDDSAPTTWQNIDTLN
jgi:hypothetical protein